MLKQMLCALAFVCIIQEMKCRPPQTPTKPSPVQEAIQKINPELDKITLRLKELKLEIYKTLLQSFTEVHEQISKFGRETFEAVSELQFNTIKVANAANEGDTDIESCLCDQREKIERVAMVANSKAERASEDSQLHTNNFTAKANELVKEADDIDKNLNKIIGYCIRQNTLAWQQEKLSECLFNEASYVNKKVDELYKQKCLINGEWEIISNSIATNQASLLKWIAKLREEFLQCVSESELRGYLNDSEVSQDDEVLGDKDINVAHGPVKEEMAQQDSTDTDKTRLFNLNQKIQTTEDKFEQQQGILERIRKVELLLNRLKEVHQYGDMENVENTSSFLNSNKSGLTNTAVSPQPTKSKKNEATGSSEQNRKFFLYISF